EVIAGRVKLVDPELSGHFAKLMEWADQFRALKVRTNADTPEDAKKAREFGAEGIGLCRTEHMFFGEERIKAMREMILAKDAEARRKPLDYPSPYQREDYYGILKSMVGLSFTIRLMDPHLLDFLSHD